MTDLNVTDAIFAVAEQRPHAVAIVDGETIVSYHSLCNGVRLAARRFQQAGWRAGDVVGISLRVSPAMHLLVAVALARSGITQVSLSPGDPVPLIRSRLQDFGVSGLVSDHAPVTEMRIATVAPEPHWLADAPDAAAADDSRVPGGDRIWIVGESSGTTGKPKLIGISHDVEDAHGRRQAPVFGYRPGERFLNLTGMRFLTGIKRAIRCLSEGGTPVFPPAGVDAERLMRWIDLHDVTYLSCVPMHLHQLLGSIRTDRPRLPSLRILRSSGSPLPASVLHEVRRRISPNVYVDYGLNEVSTIVAATPDMLAAHPDAAGRPLAGVELEIVDDLDQPLPSGASGLVRARGLGIQPTYYRAGSQDRAGVFRNGWCYPGDIGFKSDDGLLFIKGRADDVMNFDGIMIGPGEIEAVLRQHPAVADVAAFALPSPEHQDLPAAAIVPAQALKFDELGALLHGAARHSRAAGVPAG